jgi:hypothetical protein
MKMVGVIVHGIGAYVFMVDKNWSADPNLTIEILHRVLGTIPIESRVLYVQMDNCARENKNKDVFAYLSYLVKCGLFDRVEASFLPVGHTHEDIDQLFSVIGNYLKTHDAYTLSDFMKCVKLSSAVIVKVVYLTVVAQIKQMMHDQNWIEPLQGHSHIGSLLFEKNNDNVTVMYKSNMSDDLWIGDEDSNAFTIMLRDVRFDKNMIEDARPVDMPKDIIQQMKINVASCATRIRNHYDYEEEAESKIQDLYEHVRKLEHPESTEFHWDLSIYQTNEESFEESENEENESNSRSSSSEESEVDAGRRERRHIRTEFRVGQQRSLKVGNTYEPGDMLVLITSNFVIN